MITMLRVPRLYPEMEEATIGRWLIREGEPASPRAPVVEIITDKVSYEVEAPESEETQVLLVACALEKSVLPVESVLAVLGTAGTSEIPDWRFENERLVKERQAALSGDSAPSRPAADLSTPASGPPGIVRATPAARRAARAAGAELEEIAKIASGATITEADVERYVKQKGSR